MIHKFCSDTAINNLLHIYKYQERSHSHNAHLDLSCCNRILAAVSLSLSFSFPFWHIFFPASKLHIGRWETCAINWLCALYTRLKSSHISVSVQKLIVLQRHVFPVALCASQIKLYNKRRTRRWTCISCPNFWFPADSFSCLKKLKFQGP
jgi:hypothetical protein